MRSALLMALVGLAIPQVIADSTPMWLGRRELVQNEALVGAQQYNGGTSTSSAGSQATSTGVNQPSAVANKVVASATPTAAATVSLDLSKLTSLGFKALGLNAAANSGTCWIGSDGPNVHTVTNAYSSSIYLVWWGVASGAVSASYSISFMSSGVAPLITYGLAPGASVTISCNNDVSGGFAGVYPDTTLTSYGQIGNTWGEFTTGQYGTYDVSREVFMSGHSLSISSSACTTDMSNCVFVCTNGANSCGAAGTYQIQNCVGTGKQTSADGMNGGCFMGANAKVSVTFS